MFESVLLPLLGALLLSATFRLLSSKRGDALSLSIRFGALFVLVVANAALLLWMNCNIAGLSIWAGLLVISVMTLRQEQTLPYTRRLGRYSLTVFGLSIFLISSLCFLHLPVMTFLTSPGEIGIHLGYLLENNVTQAMLVVYVALLFYAALFSPRLRAIFAIVALALSILSLVYSFVLPFGYPMMSGLMFEQIPVPALEIGGRGIVDALVVFVVAALTSWGVLRVRIQAIALALVLVNVSLAVATATTMHRDTLEGGTNSKDERESSARPLVFSKTNPNVLILFLDRFMGSFVEEILQKHPELYEQLSGFVWYPLTVSAGENSVAGVHPIFGGYDYGPSEMNRRRQSLRDLSVESFQILPLNFGARGYKSNLLSPRGLGFTVAGDCTYMADIEGTECSHVPPAVTAQLARRMGYSTESLSKSNYADLLVLLGAMRGAPYMLKAVLNEKGPWQPFLDHSAGTTFQQWAELKSLSKLSTATATDSQLNIYWNTLPHEPYFMADDCQPAAERLNLTDEQLSDRGASSLFEEQHRIATRCTLLLVAEYMDWLKEAGVYDNTKIVLVSDHGIVGPVEDHSTRAEEGGTTAADFVKTRSLLMVKERDADGSLSIDDEFLPNAEVPRIVCEEIGGCTNPFLGNKPIETLGRDDPFVVDIVPWQFNLQKPEAFRIKRRFLLKGKDPYNQKGWSEVPVAANEK